MKWKLTGLKFRDKTDILLFAGGIFIIGIGIIQRSIMHFIISFFLIYFGRPRKKKYDERVV